MSKVVSVQFTLCKFITPSVRYPNHGLIKTATLLCWVAAPRHPSYLKNSSDRQNLYTGKSYM